MNLTSKVLMVEPSQFGFNPETALTNSFMSNSLGIGAREVRELALREFDGLVEALDQHGVEIIRVSGEHDQHTPDAVFPNNWITTHDSGEIILYPMAAKSRRAERRPEIVDLLKTRFEVEGVLNLSSLEERGQIVEGTGSLVFDRGAKVAYAGLSSRTHRSALAEFERWARIRVVQFEMRDRSGGEIYHTNVMMALGRELAVICLDAIASQPDRERVIGELERSGRRIVKIGLDQITQFCGNVLQLATPQGEALWVMSETARRGFRPEQLRELEQTGNIVSAPIPTLETLGGGSARCMLAEIFLKPRV